MIKFACSSIALGCGSIDVAYTDDLDDFVFIKVFEAS
jgi:hypothetical protein